MTPREFIARRGRYQKVFSGPDGEWVLADICRWAGYNKPTFVAGDSHFSAYQEGMRGAALNILKYCKGDIAKIVDQLNRQHYENPIES